MPSKGPVVSNQYWTRALHVDSRRSAALTGTYPGTLPLPTNIAGLEQP